MSTLGTTSAMAGAPPTPEAEREKEHLANVRRLKAVFLVGLVTWLVAGVPADVVSAASVPGLDLVSLLRVRIATALVFALALWALSDDTAPAPRWLRVVEGMTFGSAAAASGLLSSEGSMAAQLACILLAQGIASPRPWRRGLRALTPTLAAFVVAAALCAWRDDRTLDAVDVGAGAGALAIVVAAGNTTWSLRRRGFAARQIGRYQLKKKIGSGGTGEVWLAWHAGLKCNVALKLLRAERFLGDIDATARLCHPNTVRVLDRGVADGDHWYCAMELVDGRTLRALVDVEGPLSPARAVHVVLQASRALAEAHGLGIVHRDVKPENVLVSVVGRDRDFVKVCDFGAPGAASFAWAAPEQLRGAAVDARADVFGLGRLLAFALTGEPPPSRGTTSLGAAPSDVRAVVERCLAADPAQRYADAGEVALALGATGAAERFPLSRPRWRTRR